VGTITNGGYVVLNRSNDLTFTTLIIGTGGFMKNNIHNTVTITNANSYTGVTWLNYGTLLITDLNETNHVQRYYRVVTQIQ
jgi:hypothetical protein